MVAGGVTRAAEVIVASAVVTAAKPAQSMARAGALAPAKTTPRAWEKRNPLAFVVLLSFMSTSYRFSVLLSRPRPQRFATREQERHKDGRQRGEWPFFCTGAIGSGGGPC
jgi:hypothetical protein